MAWDDEMIWCDGCGVEITWGGLVVKNRTYCCQDCAHGIPCPCGDRMEIEEERRDSASSAIPTGGYVA